MAVSLSPLFNPDQAVVDANGDPRTGAHLHTYAAGTATPVTTYQDSGGTVPHANPILLSANGLPPAPIWITNGAAVKFVLAPSTDTTPPTSPILTIDNITGINDITSVATTEWTASGMTPTYISGTSFSVTGDQTSTLHVNRRLKLTESGSPLYGTIIKSTYTSLTTVTVLLDSGTLTSDFTGNDFWYGITSAANTSLPFVSRDQQCGRLTYVSTTSIRLDPQDGNTIWVYTGAAGWTRRAIPSAGITMANTGLSANTQYFVYLYDNAVVLTMEASTTAPAVDATSGLKIKTGDATRLLVGQIRTTTGSPGQFQANGIGVLSWYKRRAIQVTGAALSSASTNSASTVELQAAAQVKFLSWAEEAIQAFFTGYASTDATGRTAFSQVTTDGIVTGVGAAVAGTSYASGGLLNQSCGGFATVAEGYHYATIAASASAGTGTWANGGVLQVLTQG